MDLKAITDATVKMLATYLTYQAVQVIAAQLHDTSPRRAFWFNQFSGQSPIHDGEEYISRLFAEDPTLAGRVMTVRAHLAEQIAGSLPPLVIASIQQANVEQQRRYVERSLLKSFEILEDRPEG